MHSLVGAAERRSTSVIRAIVIAASAGGHEALQKILRALPPSFPAPIALVLHVAPERPSMLAQVLARATELRVKQAEAGEALRPGTVYVAPPNEHFLITPHHRVRLSNTPLEHFVRPAADRLFASAANAYGRDLLAVILSGSGQDGAAGARAVHDAGGVVIAQDPASARYNGMPLAAIHAGAVDRVLSLSEIVATLCEIAHDGSNAG